MFFDLIYVALCCGGISFTITTTSMFKSFREWISNIHPKLEELIHCPWCLGHWITIGFLLFTPKINLITGNSLVNYLLVLFSIISLEGLLHYVLLRSYEPVARYLAQRSINKLKSKKDV